MDMAFVNNYIYVSCWTDGTVKKVNRTAHAFNTYCPRGFGLSSDYFHQAEWLDFNMYRSHHNSRGVVNIAPDILIQDNW